MVDGDNKAEKRCYWDFFFKEIFLFSRELRGNYFCSQSLSVYFPSHQIPKYNQR